MRAKVDVKDQDGLCRWLREAPPGTLVPVEVLHALLSATACPPGPIPSSIEALDTPSGRNAGTERDRPLSWRSLLWSVPAETRIGREELLEAVGRPRSWLYRHTGPKAQRRIPHRKFDGELVFLVGEVRAWLREQEEIVQAGPMLESPTLRVAR